MTLLADAKKAIKPNGGPPTKKATREQINLSVAWAKGEVTLAQVTRALGFVDTSGTRAYLFLAQGLRDYIK